MTVATALKAGTVVVLQEGSGQTVTIDPKNRDKFCLAVNEAIMGCQIVDDLASILLQLRELQDRLAAWVAERRDRIHAAFISHRGGVDLLFLVVQQNIARDSTLSKELIALDIAIARDPQFDRLSLDVLSLPRASREALDAFLSSGEVLQHAGNEGP